MNRYEVSQRLASEILPAIPWLAGGSPGCYKEADAFGKHDEKGWRDTSPLVVISEESRQRIRLLKPGLGQLFEEGECDLLGAYFRMNPRGRIELYRSALTSCFWQLTLQLLEKSGITQWQLSRLAEAWVEKTLVHEEFHHRVDVLMVLFGTHSFKDRLLEEALAVACSQKHILRRGGSVGHWDNIQEGLRNTFLDCAYRYSAPGYRDWKKYEGREWRAATVSYVIHPNAQRLIEIASGAQFRDFQSGIDVLVDICDDELVDITLV
jgi:hypothetical protein